MRRALAVRVLGLLLAVTGLAGCSDETTAGDPPDDQPGAADQPSAAPFPTTLTAYVDQSRIDRVGRTVFVRLVNDDETPVTVTRAVITSDRYPELVWTGEKEVVNEGDLDVELPLGTCGTGSDAEVTMTYRVGDGPELVSTTRATDRYGAIGLLLERDCAQQTMTEAVDLTIGPDRVVGVGEGSSFRLPVTFTPTGRRDDVAFAGFEGTVLFRTAPPTPVWETTQVLPLTRASGPREVVLSLVPSRCDPHALAEDKVGTLVGVHVVAPGLADGAAFFLPISDETRGNLRGFFATYCGL